ncbi:hypothetical protein BaRGS_00015450 [Batillaria attramentaria]|uniref:Thioredoxin domain-containing protein n=1 Tax=Batillaria attramentaria TaxID=370345 RepID=A0ABD0L1P0_9CAEN
MSALKELFGDEVYGAGDKKVPTASLSDNDLIVVAMAGRTGPGERRGWGDVSMGRLTVNHQQLMVFRDVAVELMSDIERWQCNTTKKAAKRGAGIYFSAHWCPPCRAFTPKLAECYKKINDSGKKFEVIFVSSDKDQASFNDYFAEMPWLTVGFGSNKKDELSSKYSVRGIPTLILVDKNGQTKYTDGRQKVAADPEGASYPW